MNDAPLPEPLGAGDAPTTYDRVRYPSRAYAHAHPDRLSTIARLMGLTPPPVATARVLELGCGEGAHLLPIAAHLPGTQVIGVDLAPTAIAHARAAAREAGLANVRFEVADIAALPDDLGPVDYLICHGVFSWVGPEVREALLAAVRRLLSPHGVAYVSYNTFPGWHLHRVARDVMKLRARAFDDPLEAAQQGMAMVRLLAEHAVGSRTPYGLVLQQQAEMTRQYSDAYFFHDFLSEHNEPLLLTDFVDLAEAAGLAYVGDADLGVMLPLHVPVEVRQQLERAADGPVAFEQHLDLLRGTSFRRSLLTLPGRAIDRSLRGSHLRGLWVSIAGRPEDEHIDLSTDDAARFIAYNDVSVSVTGRLGKAAMLRLVQAHPQPLDFEALVEAARAWADLEPDPDSHADDIGGVLLQAYAVGLIDLAPRHRGQAHELSERPVADPLARAAGASGAERATNRRHEGVPLTRLDQVLLPLLDGTRDLNDLVDACVLAVWQGALTVNVEGEPTRDEAIIREAMEKALPDRIDRMRRTSLLVG